MKIIYIKLLNDLWHILTNTIMKKNYVPPIDRIVRYTVDRIDRVLQVSHSTRIHVFDLYAFDSNISIVCVVECMEIDHHCCWSMRYDRRQLNAQYREMFPLFVTRRLSNRLTIIDHRQLYANLIEKSIVTIDANNLHRFQFELVTNAIEHCLFCYRLPTDRMCRR